MPAILTRLIGQLKAKGHNDSEARAIAVAALQRSGNLDKDGNATKKGERRGKMSAGARAIDRAIKYSKGKRKASDYIYNRRTNRATLKKK